MADNSIVTQLTALYAAILSTGTAAWTIFRDWNDTGRLKVTVSFHSSSLTAVSKRTCHASASDERGS